MGTRTFDGGDVARKLRGKRTRTVIAKLADLRRQTVARFEEAPAKAQRETVKRLAKVYDMTEQELREAVGIAGVLSDTKSNHIDDISREVAQSPDTVTGETVQVRDTSPPQRQAESAGQQEGGGTMPWPEKAKAFVGGIKDDDQEAALEALHIWHAKLQLERTALHPAAGRSLHRSSRKK